LGEKQGEIPLKIGIFRPETGDFIV